MDEEIKNQLKEFGILDKIHFERIAVLPKQVREVKHVIRHIHRSPKTAENSDQGSNN